MTNRVEVGMNRAQVVNSIGDFQFESHASDDVGRVCLSYIHNEAIDMKFVHTTFGDGLLVSATEGHHETRKPL